MNQKLNINHDASKTEVPICKYWIFMPISRYYANFDMISKDIYLKAAAGTKSTEKRTIMAIGH